MKYRAVYAALEQRRREVPCLEIIDKSGWRDHPQTYISHCRPLWIIVEDPVANRRYWLTENRPTLKITYKTIDERGENTGTSYSVHCRNMTEMAKKLEELFKNKEMSL